jgi:DNA-binding transcriptional MerR regulator
MALAEDNEPQDIPLLTIDDLARRVGMSVRNLREWRTLGLLPPARMRGRNGFYSEAIVERVRGIQKLHAEGFTLELIRRMLEASGESGDDIMRFARAVRAPFRDNAPPSVDLAEWADRWGSARKKDLSRAVELGLLRRREDGELEYTSSRIAEITELLHSLGLTIEEVLDASGEIRAHADGIADLFERVWLEHIWQPFVDAGMPDSELPALQDSLAQVQPAALDAVIAIFTAAMESKIEQSIAREVQRARVTVTE